jgi:hypothetical protein
MAFNSQKDLVPRFGDQHVVLDACARPMVITIEPGVYIPKRALSGRAIKSPTSALLGPDCTIAQPRE